MKRTFKKIVGIIAVIASLAIALPALASIPVASNFQLSSAIPLDARVVVANVTARNAIASGSRFDGLQVYEVDNTTNYQLQGGIANGNWVTVGGSSYTFSTGITNTGGTITSNISTGVAGGQTIRGGTASGDNLTIQSTSNATKGKILFGTTSAIDEVNGRFGVGTISPLYAIDVVGGTINANSASQYAWNGHSIISGSGTDITFGSSSFTGLFLNVGSVLFKFPTADGSASDCLKTNGSAILSFSSCGGGGGTWGSITGTLSSQTDLQTALNAKQNSLTFNSGLTLTGSTVTNDLNTGVAGGQILAGGTTNSDILRILGSNASGQHGKVYFNGQNNGTPGLMYDVATGRVGMGGITSPTESLDLLGAIKMNDGNQGVGKVVMDDGSGTGKMKWTTAPWTGTIGGTINPNEVAFGIGSNTIAGLSGTAGSVLQWNNAGVPQANPIIEDSGNINSIDPTSRLLFDNAAGVQEIWDTAGIHITQALQVNGTNFQVNSGGQILDAGSQPSLVPQNRIAYDASGVTPSFDWNSRLLFDATGGPQEDFSSPAEVHFNWNATVEGVPNHTFKWNALSSAPGSTPTLLTGLTVNVYGGAGFLLGNPNQWLTVDANGTPGVIPVY